MFRRLVRFSLLALLLLSPLACGLGNLASNEKPAATEATQPEVPRPEATAAVIVVETIVETVVVEAEVTAQAKTMSSTSPSATGRPSGTRKGCRRSFAYSLRMGSVMASGSQ